MTKLCSLLLGSPSVVYEECGIECQELPHGNIDIVGRMIVEEEVRIDITLGVHIESDDSRVLIDPTGISAKTHNTLTTRALSKYTHKYKYTCCKIKLLPFTDTQAVIESLAFSEVIKNADKKPIVFLAGIVPLF